MVELETPCALQKYIEQAVQSVHYVQPLIMCKSGTTILYVLCGAYVNVLNRIIF